MKKYFLGGMCPAHCSLKLYRMSLQTLNVINVIKVHNMTVSFYAMLKDTVCSQKFDDLVYSFLIIVRSNIAKSGQFITVPKKVILFFSRGVI